MRKTQRVTPQYRARRVAGALSVYYHSKAGRFVVRQYPQKPWKDTPKRKAARDEFVSAVKMIKHTIGENHAAAYEMSPGTNYVPRDILMLATFGKLLRAFDQTGKTYVSGRSAQLNAQQMLDAISNVPGAVLVRLADAWYGLDPGNGGQVLTLSESTGLPEWADAAGGGGGLIYIGTYSPDAATNTNIDFPLSTSYDRFKVIVRGKQGPSTANMGLVVSDDGGTNFYNGSSDYKDQNSNSTSWMALQTSGSIGTGRPYIAEVTVFRDKDVAGPWVTTGTHYGVQSSGTRQAGAIGGTENGGYVTAPIDFMRVMSASAGNAINLKVDLYAYA